MDKDKINKGQNKIKQLDAGTHTNLELLRKSLNSICESQSIEKPVELQQLNELFDDETTTL